MEMLRPWNIPPKCCPATRKATEMDAGGTRQEAEVGMKAALEAGMLCFQPSSSLVTREDQSHKGHF